MIILAHGWSEGISDSSSGKKIRLNAEALAEKIKASGWKPDMEIELRACNTGNSKNGTPIAQKLADMLGSGSVKAPNKVSQIGENGRIIGIYPRQAAPNQHLLDKSKPGKIVIFSPTSTSKTTRPANTTTTGKCKGKQCQNE